MKSRVVIRLGLSPEQAGRLQALQRLFADACNFLAPTVASTRCWNRVGLHHMAYRVLRERFPQLGAQMACNAIYSVSRAARRVYQDPDSAWGVARRGAKPLPVLRFLPSAPVFFDRHTLSLKGGMLSLFTLDGRLRFSVNVPDEVEARFANDKLREVVLISDAQGFALRFLFGDADEAAADPEDAELAVEIDEVMAHE